MLEAFIHANRETIIERARDRMASRPSPAPSPENLAHGIPLFLFQLGDALRLARDSGHIDHREIESSAARHGRDLFDIGLTIAQVVYGYGDVCQIVTELAVEQKAPVGADQFRILNLCLDDAIAGAVTEYARQRERAIVEKGTERLGDLAHELRNALNTAVLSFESIRDGQVAVGGATGILLAHSLVTIQEVIDRSLADVRLESGRHRVERIAVASLIEDIQIGAELQAHGRQVRLEVASIDPTLTIEGDRLGVTAILSNLLHNAIKFTQEGTQVSVRARALSGRIVFDIEDACGGLPPGGADELFRPYYQKGADRSGMGLGLSICLKAAHASGGTLSVRDIPGKGCAFSFDIPAAT